MAIARNDDAEYRRLFARVKARHRLGLQVMGEERETRLRISAFRPLKTLEQARAAAAHVPHPAMQAMCAERKGRDPALDQVMMERPE